MLLPFNPRPGLENWCAYPFFCQFVPKRATSSTRADYQDQIIIIQIKHSWHNLNLLSIYPADVVEATMEIAALIIRRPLVSEKGPDRRVTVEVKNEVRSQRLKEWSLFSSHERLQFRLLGKRDPCGNSLSVQGFNPLGKKTGQAFVLYCFVVKLSDNVLVKPVRNAVVWEHDPIDCDELFYKLKIEVTVLIGDPRNRI